MSGMCLCCLQIRPSISSAIASLTSQLGCTISKADPPRKGPTCYELYHDSCNAAVHVALSLLDNLFSNYFLLMEKQLNSDVLHVIL